MTSMGPDGAVLVLGRRPDGTWALVEGAGPLLRRFDSLEAASRAIARLRRERPGLVIASSAGAVAGEETDHDAG